MTSAPPIAASLRTAPERFATSRSKLREYPLDGALLFFHPATGTHVRVANETTRARRREAPRVVMFGVTNACNLACSYCSRDARRESAWTVASAAAALRGLAGAGTLEVAFGGGEPLAFPGFDALLAELHATTPLAMHVTTNGTLLRGGLWRRLEGLLGQVRVSVHEGSAWRDGADLLAASGQLWGANVLVDDAAIAGLPALLAELGARRCHDVSWLSYVGPDARRQLSRDGERRLAAILAESPIQGRLSVCLGDRVPAPRLFAGIDNLGDCGAGYDFVSITPDQRVQSCSFQDEGIPAATAAEILDAWRTQRARLALPSPRLGCARRLPLARATEQLPEVAVWRAFSGNNSGECILVATFATVADAEELLGELMPGWEPEEPPSAAWRALFEAEGVAVAARDVDADGPRELGVVGSSIIAQGYDAGDAFRELRALAWKRGAFVWPGGVHMHDGPTLLAAVRARDAEGARALEKRAPPATRAYRHGDVVLLVCPRDAFASLDDAKHAIESFAGGRPLTVAHHDDPVSDAELVHAKQRLGDAPAEHPRLFVSFWGQDLEGRDAAAQAQRFAASLDDGRVCVAANGVLIDPLQAKKRTIVRAYRSGASVAVLSGVVVAVSSTLWRDQPPRERGRKAPRVELGVDAVLPALEARLPRGGTVIVETTPVSWQRGVMVKIETDAPGEVLAALAGAAAELGVRFEVGVRELAPLEWIVRRLVHGGGLRAPG